MYLVALLLLLSPIDPPVCLLDCEPLRDALTRVATDLELIDRPDWSEESRDRTLTHLRRIIWPLHGTPRLWEATRFPGAGDVDWIRGQVNFGRAVIEICEANLELRRGDCAYWASVKSETTCRLGLWRLLLESAGCGYSWQSRRESLESLREALSPGDWAAGRLPPVAPVEWFRVLP